MTNLRSTNQLKLASPAQYMADDQLPSLPSVSINPILSDTAHRHSPTHCPPPLHCQSRHCIHYYWHRRCRVPTVMTLFTIEILGKMLGTVMFGTPTIWVSIWSWICPLYTFRQQHNGKLEFLQQPQRSQEERKESYRSGGCLGYDTRRKVTENIYLWK